MLSFSAAPRRFCLVCEKPESTCLCARIRRLDNRTPIAILQHPRERAHPIGTARLARLGLSNVHVEVAWDANAIEAETQEGVPSFDPDAPDAPGTDDADDQTEL